MGNLEHSRRTTGSKHAARAEENRESKMEAQHPDKENRPPKTSAHVCPQCGFAIDLKDLGLREGATGLVTCLHCDWSGPITIGIVPKDSAG